MKQLIGILALGLSLCAQAQTSNQISVSPGGSININSNLAIRISNLHGQLVDQETGAPIPHCRITLQSSPIIITPLPAEQPAAREMIVIPPPESIITPIPGPSPIPVPRPVERVMRSTYTDAEGLFTFDAVPLYNRQSYSLKISNASTYQDEYIPLLSSSWSQDINIVELKKRPYYFEAPALFTEAGKRAVHATVYNNTDETTYMRFWLTGTLTRSEDTAFQGCSSSTRLLLDKKRRKHFITYKLEPGENHIKLNLKAYSPYLKLSDITLSGGRSFTEPLLPSAPIRTLLTIRPPLVIDPPVIIEPPVIINPPIIVDPPVIIDPPGIVEPPISIDPPVIIAPVPMPAPCTTNRPLITAPF